MEFSVVVHTITVSNSIQNFILLLVNGEGLSKSCQIGIWMILPGMANGLWDGGTIFKIQLSRSRLPFGRVGPRRADFNFCVFQIFPDQIWRHVRLTRVAFWKDFWNLTDRIRPTSSSVARLLLNRQLSIRFASRRLRFNSMFSKPNVNTKV